MLGLDERGYLAVDPRPRVDQLGGVELVATVVALVATGMRVAADGAGALDIAIGQRAPGGRADGAGGGPRDDVAVAVQRQEDLLHDLCVVAGGGAGVEVVGDAEPAQVLRDDTVVLV